MVFGAYGVLHELIRPTQLSFATIYLNGIGFLNQLTLITTVVFTGSITTAEAEKTALIYNKTTSLSELNENQKIDYIYLMTQIRSRNLNIQNIFFNLNWNVFLAVSL